MIKATHYINWSKNNKMVKMIKNTKLKVLVKFKIVGKRKLLQVK